MKNKDNKAAPRVLFLAIDSAEPELLRRWSEDGSLPTLKTFYENGAWGNSQNFPAVGSDACWTSLWTGVPPGQHDRYFYRQFTPGTYRSDLYEPAPNQTAPFWSQLSEQQQKVAVIDVPYTSPPDSLNGIHLIDWLAHDRKYDEPVGFPQEVVTNALKFGKDELGMRDLHGRTSEEFREVEKHLHKRTAQKEKLIAHYLDEQDWDLFMGVFHDGHDAGHQFWHIHDADHPMHDAEYLAKYGDPLKSVYVEIDAAIGRLLERVGNDTTVLLFAGPGMGPNYTANFIIDDVLRCLEYGPRAPSRLVDAARSAFRMLPDGVRNFFKDFAAGTDEALLASDRRTRKYFALPHNELSGAIRINVKGREADGIVSPGAEYDELCEFLTNELNALVDPRTGHKVVKRVLKTKDVYSGRFESVLPDLWVEWTKEAEITALQSPTIGTVSRTYPGSRTGDHTPNTVLFAKGPLVKQGELGRAFQPVDFAPTIAELLGMELEGMAGTNIEEISPVKLQKISA